MNRFGLYMVAVAMLSLVNVGWGEQEDTRPMLRLACNLVDGSHIIGAPKVESIPIQTPYAKINIPVKRITSIKIENDHETASFELQNGDKLKGVLNIGRLELDTIFGKALIGMKHITSIEVFSRGTIGPLMRESLVLYFSFDNDTGVKITDQSANKNDGKIANGTHAQHGKVGRGFEFKGNSRIVIPDSDSLRVQQHTLSMWAKASKPINGQHCLLLSKEKHGAAGGYYLAYDHNKVNYKLMEGGRSSQGYHNTYKTMNLVPNKWYHLVGTFDGKTRTLYVNGERAESKTQSMVLFHDTTPVEIGNKWNGLIDEVMIFNHCLTTEEARTLYIRSLEMAEQENSDD